MRRRLRQLLILLCLILAVAAAGLWVRSGWRADLVWHQHSVLTAADGSAISDRRLGATSLRGRIQLWAARDDYSSYRPGSLSVPPAVQRVASRKLPAWAMGTHGGLARFRRRV